MLCVVQRSQRKHNEPNQFKAFRRACFFYARIHSIKLCSMVDSIFYWDNGWQQRWWWWYQVTLLPIRWKSVSFFFSSHFFLLLLCSVLSVEFVALWMCLRIVFSWTSLSLSFSHSALKIEFISIHLFFYWIFYFRSIRFRCVFPLL